MATWGLSVGTSGLKQLYSPSHLNLTGWSSLTSWLWGLLSNLGNVVSPWPSVGTFLVATWPTVSWLPRPHCPAWRAAGGRAAGFSLSSLEGDGAPETGTLGASCTFAACRVMVLEVFCRTGVLRAFPGESPAGSGSDSRRG